MLDVAGHAVSLPGVVALGVVVGYLAGMFGVGGGFLLTPLLTVVFGVPLPIAAGTGLCQMVGTALVALLRHRDQRLGEPRFDLIMLVGGVVGVDAGTRALTILAHAGTLTVAGRIVPVVNAVVDPVYIVVLLLAAVMFWAQGGAGEHRGEPVLLRFRIGPMVELPSVGVRASALVIGYIGFALGFLSGLLGIGGGVALMPVLVYGFGFSIRQAAGTGILMLMCTSSVGTLAHALRGDVHLGLAMTLLAGSSISAQLGARTTARVSQRVLRRAFAIVVVITAAAVAWDLTRRLT